MTNYYLPIGDWSNDGHGVCKNILIESKGTINEIRNAHFKIKKVTGIDIHDIANEYEENTISIHKCLELMKLGLDINDYLSQNYKQLDEKSILEDDEYYIEYDEIAELWVDLLNYVDNSLEIKIVKDEIEMIPFYGFDEKKRHIGFVGYGTLGN